MNIRTVKDFKVALRTGPYAWPGGYPLYFLCSDGEALSFTAARQNAKLIMQAVKHQDRTGGWLVEAMDINYEDTDLYCVHTNERIESAYGEENPS
jgi:hypothetical protein